MQFLSRFVLSLPLLIPAVLVGAMLGCAKPEASAVDTQPFEVAIAQYLKQNNMAMALKEIKEGPVVEDKTARLTASLTHETLGGPAVTWQFRFAQEPDGTWKAVSHR